MGVSRDLQVEAGAGGRGRRVGLVRKQDLSSGMGRGTAQRRNRVAVLIRIKVMGAQVRDAGEYQRSAIMIQDHMLVLENLQPETLDFSSPGALPGVVLVIAGHEVNTVPGRESGQRCRVDGQLLNRTVHKIAGHCD